MWFKRLPDKIHARMAAFSLVGLANTVVGVSVIAIAHLLGASPVLANVFGYGAGLLVSFSLNSRITFQRRMVDRYAFARFLCAFAIAFLANIAIVLVVTDVLQQHGLLASLAGVPLYTFVFYALCEHWVFRHPHADSREELP